MTPCLSEKAVVSVPSVFPISSTPHRICREQSSRVYKGFRKIIRRSSSHQLAHSRPSQGSSPYGVYAKIQNKTDEFIHGLNDRCCLGVGPTFEMRRTPALPSSLGRGQLSSQVLVSVIAPRLRGIGSPTAGSYTYKFRRIRWLRRKCRSYRFRVVGSAGGAG